MTHSREWFEHRVRAVLFALAIGLACARPVKSGAADGRWVQLGAPIRAGSPVLRDEANRRLVLIGANAFGAPPTLSDAWEFREATGWGRIELPHPPAWSGAGPGELLADHAHGRYLGTELIYGTPLRVRLWALEVGPPARWVQLDQASSCPLGEMVLDAEGSAIWVFQRYPDLQLWTRSLADTGQWRIVRSLPANPAGLVNRGIDFERRRVVAFCRRYGPGDSVIVATLPLDSNAGWSELPREGAWPSWPASSVTVSDPARDRLLLLAWGESSAAPPASWSYDLTGAGGWADIGPTLERAPGALAAWGDTLWGWSHDPRRQVAELVVAPLGSPQQARTVHRTTWPGTWRFAMGAFDPVNSRWLLAGGQDPNSFRPFPADSLEELVLDGDMARWRTIAVTGEAPHDYQEEAWARDESKGTLYLVCRTVPWMHGGVDEEQLWAMHPESPPRWSLVWRGEKLTVDDSGVLAFDPRTRRLVLMGLGNYGEPGNDRIFSMRVDEPRGWDTITPGGQAPRYVEKYSAILDPIRERLVFGGFVPGATGFMHALELADEPRWAHTGLYCDASAPGDCIHQFTTGIYDPVARRVLQFGGWSMTEMVPYDDLWAINSGDTLGPLRRMAAIGSPGRQVASTAAFDARRDALLAFDDRTCGLYEFRFERGQVLVARPVSAEACADGNRLTWSGTPGGAFVLWRCEASSEWTEFARVSMSPSGDLDFVDREVEAGARYGYRLTTGPSEFETAGADVWVAAASAGPLALASPWPNPSHGGLDLSFTLATAAPADVEIFDLAGRRTWARRFDSLAPGPHHLTIGVGELPRSGLYFVRLRQAGVTATRRAVVAR